MSFGAVVTFIEESLNNADKEIPVFKLSDLVKMYVDNLEKMGLHLETRVHSTRFKIRLLSQFPDPTVYNSKKEVILIHLILMLEKQFLLLLKQTLMMMAIFLLKLPTSCAGKLITTQKICLHSPVYIKSFRKNLGGCCWSFLSGLELWRFILHCLWGILTSCVLKFFLVQLDLNKIKALCEKCLSHCLRSLINFPYIFSLCYVK